MTRWTLERIFANATRRVCSVASTALLVASGPAWPQHVPVDIIGTPPAPPSAVGHLGLDERPASENAIRSVRVVAETARELTLDVDYSYTGDHGPSVFINAHASEVGAVVPGTGAGPGPVSAGNRSTRVVLVAAAPEAFSSDAIQLQMYASGGNPFVKQAFAFRKTWSTPTAALPIQLPLAGSPAPQPAPPDASRTVERRIADDGAVELVYGDGRVKRLYSGGYTIIYPDGRRQSASFMSQQPPTAPDPPPDDALYAWFQKESDWLLDLIRTLVGHNETSVNNYLAKEPTDVSLLHRIWLRQQAVARMVQP